MLKKCVKMFLLVFVQYTQLWFEDNCYCCWATLEIHGYLFLFLDKRYKNISYMPR